MADPADLPTGTVTFLYTDLEGSTRQWEQQPAAMRAAVARHAALLRQAIRAHGGRVFRTAGDGLCAAFATAPAALAAAADGQRALHGAAWGAVGPLRARMALHTGAVAVHDGDYVGACLNRLGRLLAAGHGGQTVLSQATADLGRDALPAGAGLRDLGEHRLRDLPRPERVFQLLHPELPGEFPPLRSLDAQPHNLPLQLTSFVGREQETAAVRALVATHRLVTLTGTGGTGKTRLALQVAADALPEYPDGVWLVDLAPLADPALVPAAVAAAVGVREAPSRPLLATLVDALRPKRLLLVLDNCEHLVEVCARLAAALLRACPSLRLLATSREVLGVAGETVWAVPPLALPPPPAPASPSPPPGPPGPPAASAAPDARALRQPPGPPPMSPDRLAQYGAVRLFVDRASAALPTFRVTAQNAAAVAQVCRRLDGIPLALELAAARVRVLPPEQLLGRLEDRFRLLTGGSRTALERHQTLRAAVDWSHHLLTESEKVLFRRLSVFSGGWTLEAAEAVCAGEALESRDVLGLLTRLVDKSLVVVEEQPDGTARYRLLETLRQYAAGRLAGAARRRTAQRHAAYYLRLAEVLGPAAGESPPVSPAEALGRLERESANLRAAMARAVQRRDTHAGLRLAVGLWPLWTRHGPVAEARQWLETLLRLPETAPPGPAVREVRRLALDRAGMAAQLQNDLVAARSWFGQALAASERAGDRVGRARALGGLGTVALAEGDHRAARTCYDRALTIARETGAAALAAGALINLGNLAFFDGDHAAARARWLEALEVRRADGSPAGRAALAHHHLGVVALEEGDVGAARAWGDAGLAAALSTGDQFGTARVLQLFALIAAAEGHLERAVRLGGAAAARGREAGGSLSARWDADFRSRLEVPTGGWVHTSYGAAWAAGQAMPLEQAVADALADAPDVA